MVDQTMIAEFLESHGFRDKTKRSYGSLLRRYVESVQPGTPRWVEGSIAWVTDLPVEPSSKQYYVAVLNSFFKWLTRTGKVASNPFESVKIRVSASQVRQALTLDEVQALLHTTREDGDESSLRDYAILMLMLHTAMRIGGVIGLNLEDFEKTGNNVIAKYQAKGHIGKDSFVVVPKIVVDTIQDYLAASPPPRSLWNDKGPLFVTLWKRRLSYTGMRYLIMQRFEQAGITREGIAVHSLRHTAATTAYHAGVDLLSIKEMLDHKSLQTTQGYLHSIDRIEKAAELRIDYGIAAVYQPAGAEPVSLPGAATAKRAKKKRGRRNG